MPYGGCADFLTDFVLDDNQGCGRSGGLTVMHDGAVLRSEDGNGAMRRVTPTGR